MIARTIRARSAPNIAFIKYWGNRNEELRIPVADSLSMTLDHPLVEIAVKPAKKFALRSFETNGDKKDLSEKEIARLHKHFKLVRQYAASKKLKGLPEDVSVEIRSHIPQSIGLASSAAVFSVLAEGYAGFIKNISRKDISVLARLGSGSASRSVYGGFVAMVAGKGNSLGASYAVQIAPENHWRLWDIVVAPSVEEKKTGSTEGHALAPTSPLFKKRMREIGARQKRCIDAILNCDFAALQKVAEEDSLDMHEVMRTSNPPLEYLNSETHRIIAEIKKLRESKNLNVLYTMDAGPTVHLVCDEDALAEVRDFARAQKNCTVFEAKIAGGSTLV